ncbi:MAG: SDR family oxidoreductase [Bacteroidales bacterium]
MTKILIVGANGFVGRRILEKLSQMKDYQVYACSRGKDIRPALKYQFTQIDLSNLAEFKTYIESITPDVIINAAALSSPQECQNNTITAMRINVEAVREMSNYTEQNEKYLIHLSTDFVFSGNRKRLYAEDDEKDPQNYYGETKSKSEDMLLNTEGRYAIARIEVVFGEHYPGQHGNIFTLVRNNLQKGLKVQVVNDQYRTPTFVDDVVWGVEALIRKQPIGIFHFAGPEYLSIADFAYRIARFFQLDESLIESVSSRQMCDTIRRPRYSGLSIKKSRKILGYNPGSIAKALNIISTPQSKIY